MDGWMDEWWRREGRREGGGERGVKQVGWDGRDADVRADGLVLYRNEAAGRKKQE